ncbi:MAG TPA: FAD-dependent oxidoreductase [Acidobacteriaceae bacterium]
MRQPRDIAIAGGGVIGLACALELRRRGFEVTIFDAGEAAKEASWAAGGMLAAEDPENPAGLLSFSRYSRKVYREFFQQIHELSGNWVLLHTRETVQVVDPGHRSIVGTRISLERARRLIPGLSGADHEFLLLKEDSLDPRDLCTALLSAAVATGVALREHERVLSVELTEHGVLLATPHGTFRADAFVNCCGAWAASLSPSIAVVPRKGQMLAIAQPYDTPLIRVLRSPDVYLIPRGGDRIVVGATVEDAGYSKQVEARALARLRELAAALWAPAGNAPQMDSWAGLRPATPDGLPVIGRYDNKSLHFVATGHFRNGILLAPGTARVIADLLCGVAPAVDLAPFAPHRPSMNQECDKHFTAAL